MSIHLDYTTQANDRWDLIAYRHYGRATRTRELIEANRALFLPVLGPLPAIIPAGLAIRVPVLDVDPLDPALLPPWKR